MSFVVVFIQYLLTLQNVSIKVTCLVQTVNGECFMERVYKFCSLMSNACDSHNECVDTNTVMLDVAIDEAITAFVSSNKNYQRGKFSAASLFAKIRWRLLIF